MVAAGLLAFGLYLGTCRNEFVFDDIDIIAQNPHTRDPAALKTIFGSHYWGGNQNRGNLYRPLTILSFAFNHALTGSAPAGYHLTNAALHGAVSALVAALAAAFGLGRGGALASGLLFAAHPIHVEAVTPVVGRSELLAALFCLGAWICHLSGTCDAARPGRLAAAAALFAAGLLSKENAAVLPALILAGDLVFHRSGPWRPRLLSLGISASVLMIWLAVRAAVVPGLPPADSMGSVYGEVDVWSRLLTATGVLGRYLYLMLYPVALSADYSFSQIPLITAAADPPFVAAAAAHLGLAAFGIALGARGRLSGLALLIYLGALFPVSNIPFSIGTVMAERLLYLPSVGLCLLAPALFAESRGRPGGRTANRAAAGALIVVCLLYGIRVTSRNADWKDQFSLFSVTVRTSPNSAKAHYNLGVAYEDLGDLDAAMEAYRRALEIKPDQPEPRRNYGLALLTKGRPDQSLEQLNVAARLDPNLPDVFNDIGAALRRLGRLEEAAEAFQEEIRLRPEAWRAHYNLGTLRLDQGRPREALSSLSRAASLDPSDPDAHAQRGFALAMLGRHAEAVAALSEALRLNPGLVETLVPLARSALASGQPDVAARAAVRARRSGVSLPADLAAGLAP